MIKIIVSIVFLLALFVLVVLNLGHTTSVNVFWVTFESVSVVVIGMACFVLGLLYALFLYASRYIVGLRKSALVNRRLDVGRREKEATARDKEASLPASKVPSAGGGASTAEDAEPSRRWWGRRGR